MADAAGAVARTVLSNGLVVAATRTRGAPVFTAMLVLEAGSRHDLDGKSGLADLTAGVVVEGTTRLSAEGIALGFDSLGASIEVAVGYETAAIIVSGLPEHFDRALGLLAEVAQNPRFAAGAVRDTRERQLAEIAEDAADPFLVCRSEFMRTVFRGHRRANPVTGLAETLKKVEPRDLRAFHEGRYRPRSSILAVAGAVDVPLVLDAATESFRDWPPGDEPESRLAPPTRQSEMRRHFVEMDREQAHVSLGNLGIARSDPAFYATSVMDVILGDSAGFGSRLASKLRERDGLAYVIESDTVGTAGLEPGVFWVYTATSPDAAEAAIEAILNETRVIREEPPSSEEVASAIAYLCGRHVLDRETTESRAAHLVHTERHGLGPDYDEAYASVISSVTADDVLAAARRVIDPDHCSVVVVGPAASSCDVSPDSS